LQQLRDIGVELPPTSALLDAQARGWRSPILAARSRLTLMLPSADEEVHPAWLTLLSLMEQPTIMDIERVLGGATTSDVTAVPHRPLPRRRRWWQLPAGVIHGWDRSASFSSLEQFFNNPCQWAMNYPARLKSSAVLDLPDQFRLLGNLAHRMVEQLYRHADALSWSTPRLEHWFDDAVERIVREEGAVLLMRGRRAALEGFRMRSRVSLVQLHEHLRAAGAIGIEPEKYMEGATPLGALRGSIDLVVTLADGRQAIIDMKWAGNTKYREKMNKQSHVQLAIYARLLENNTSAWPAVGYFILREPELLTTSDTVFPGITPIRVPGASTAMLWDQIMATWAWRRTQIEAGALECVLEGLEPTAASEPPSSALAIEELNPLYNACANLAGWEEGA
jgi:RecB family exonuclease